MVPHVKKGWLRENEPSPQPTSKMPRENELGINPSNGHHQSPTSFGDSSFGESSFGDSVACSFPCGRLDHVNGPVFSTDFGSSHHCPTGCPGFGHRVQALRAGAMDAAPATAAARGAGGDGGEDGGDRPDKSWVEPYNPSKGEGEKKKRKRKKKKAKEGQQPEQEGEDAEMEKPEDTKHNIWFEGQQESALRHEAMKARQARQAARREYTEGKPEKPEEETEVAVAHEEWSSWEAVPVEVSDEEADPGQALPHEELGLTEANAAAQGVVPEPKYPPKGVYKPPPLVLRPKLKANPPEPMPVPKPSPVVEDTSRSVASTTPGTSSTTADAASSSAAAPVPSPMASAPERPEGLVTYSVRTVGRRDREAGYFNSQGDRVPRRRINQKW